MSQIWYRAVERFDTDHPGWEKYLEFSKLNQVTELITLDALLCATLTSNLLQTDWDFVIQEDYLTSCFTDLDYLVARTIAFEKKHLLAVIRSPEKEEKERAIENGKFVGYDLIEQETGISALTNCGGYPESFKNGELNQHGLLPTYVRAKEVQKSLWEYNPEDPHADTIMWAIWKLEMK